MEPHRLAALVAAALALGSACSKTPHFADPASGGGGAGGSGGASSSSSGGSGAGAGPNCWGNDPTMWPETAPVDKKELGDEGATSPKISLDGLTLTFIGGLASARAPYQAHRTVKISPFKGSAPLAGWQTQWGNPTSLWIELGDAEIAVSTNGNGSGLSFSALTKDMTWSLPVNVGAAVNTMGTTISSSSLTEDGALLYFARNDGADSILGPTSRIYESARKAPVTPGDALGAVTPVVIPGIGATDQLLCPVVSADGDHLFFGTSYPLVINQENYTHAVTVWYTARTDSGWTAPTHIAVLDHNTTWTCPRSVTADGCELWVERTSVMGTETEISIARRYPPAMP